MMKGWVVVGLFVALVACCALLLHDMTPERAPAYVYSPPAPTPAPVQTVQPPPPQRQEEPRPVPAPAPEKQEPVRVEQPVPVQEAPPPPRKFAFTLTGTRIALVPTTLGSIVEWQFEITNLATSVPVRAGMWANPLIGSDEIPGTQLDVRSDPVDIPPGASATVTVKVGVNGMWQNEWTSLPGSQYQALSCRHMRERYPLWTGFVAHMDGANLILPLPCQ